MYQPEKWLPHFIDIIQYIPMGKVKELAKMIMASKQVIFAGNGGSYANASHMAGDILVNSTFEGNTLCLGDNFIAFTALSNDVAYEDAMAAEYLLRHKKDTLLILLSTSGKSKNIIKLAKMGKKSGAKVAALTGLGIDKSLYSQLDLHIELKSIDAGMLESAFDFIGHLLVKALN